MSIVRLAVRLAAVQAIKGSTLAQDRVYDSDIATINDLLQKDAQPFVIVTTDDDELVIDGRDLLSGQRDLDLVIECALAGKTKAGDIDIPHTDPGMELILDLMHRQITRVFTSEENVWSVDFKRLVPRIKKVASRRGASSEEGIRFAARQIILTIDTINEPDFGVELDDDHPLKSLTDHLTADSDELAIVSAVILAEIKGTSIPEWARVLPDLGMTKSEAQGVRVGDYIEDEAADIISEVDAENMTTGVTHIIDENEANDQDPGA